MQIRKVTIVCLIVIKMEHFIHMLIQQIELVNPHAYLYFNIIIVVFYIVHKGIMQIQLAIVLDHNHVILDYLLIMQQLTVLAHV